MNGAIRRHGLTIAIFAMLAVLATAWQGWGLPENWPPDEVPSFVANMLRKKTANPGYFMYPSLMIHLTWLVSVALDVSPDGTGPGHVARSWSAVFYLLTVLLLGKTVKEALRLERTPPFAFFFVGTIGALVHHAHIGNVNESLFFAIALALWLFVRTIRTGSERDFYLSVAACSLAVGAKYNGCFLFGLLPLVWVLAFGEIRSRRFVRALVVSVVIAPIPFLLTTPYILLDWPSFHRDWIALTKVEGPAFKTGVGALGLVRYFVGFNLGFFSPVTCVVAGLWSAVAYARWFRHRPEPLLGKSALLLAATFVLYFAMTVQIGIYQSRYFLPASLVLAVLFLVVFCAPEVQAPRLRAATLALLVVANGANAWAHVSGFPHSAKSLALPCAEELLASEPGARLGVISIPRRPPLEHGALDARQDVFMTEDPHEGVETWPQYLDLVSGYFARTRPRWILFERSVVEWPLLLPWSKRADYGERLADKNPGLEAWDAALARAGYVKVRTIESGEDQRLLRVLLGPANGASGPFYLATAEGLGRPVLVYGRR